MLNFFALSLRSVVRALLFGSLMAGLMLGTPDAHAGTYSCTYSGGTQYVNTQSGLQTISYLPSGSSWGGNSIGGNYAACTGGISAVFTWQPASGQTMTSDPPPAQVLIMESCGVSVGLGASAAVGTYDNGLGISGTLLYKPNSSNYINPSSVRYTIKPGGPTVSLGPLNAFAKVSEVDPSRSSSSVNYTANVYPITLASPDPTGHPELGDGKNQYTYETSQPSGQLMVPASVYVAGASTAATVWLLPHVALSVSPKMQTGAQPFVWTASGSGMYVETTGTRPGYASPWPTGDFCYIGLPTDNTYFGNHVMTMLVDGTAAQTANYQLFFSKNGQNSPNCDPARQINWYHYYNLLYPSPDDDPAVEVDATFSIGLSKYGETEWYPPANYNPATPYGYGLSGWTAGITIGNQAGGATSLPIFDLGGPKGLVRYVGALYVKGIQTYALTCAHEVGHRTLMQDGIYYPYNRSDNPPYGFADNDGDGLSDSWEAQHHLDPTNPDTTEYYENNSVYNYGDTGDLECLCEILAFKGLLANQSLWQQDWSDGGLQIGVVPSPDFYWQFRPAVAAGSYTTGNIYKVRTLADLRQAYPTVLSDLP